MAKRKGSKRGSTKGASRPSVAEKIEAAPDAPDASVPTPEPEPPETSGSESHAANGATPKTRPRPGRGASGKSNGATSLSDGSPATRATPKGKRPQRGGMGRDGNPSDPAWWKRFRDLTTTDRRRWAALRGESNGVDPLKSLAAVYSLLGSLDTLDSELALVVAEQVRRQANEATSSEGPIEDPWTLSLRRIELPLALALVDQHGDYAADEPHGAAVALETRRDVAATWSRAIDEHLDGDGMPHGDLVPEMRELLSCWSRCEALAALTGESLLSPERRIQCQRLLAHAIDWSLPDGTERLATTPPTTDSVEAFACFDLARRVFGSEESERKLAALATLAKSDGATTRATPKPSPNGAEADAAKKARTPPKSPAVKARETLATSVYSEWSKAALLTGNVIDRDPPCLAVTFSHANMRVGLSAAGTRWLAGSPAAELKLDGRVVPLDQPWDEVCWHDDEESVYLEVEMDVGAGWRLQRQMLVGRKDRFFFVADAVLGPLEEEPREIEWKCRWPLAPGVDAVASDKAREATLVAGSTRCLALPIAEHEWRAQPSEGELLADENSLTVSRRRRGRALYAPLWLDLHPERSKRPFTWRRLTVAETMEVVSQDTAVGFRVQTGDDQFLVYRSLGARGNRTVLGKNLVEECLVARFLKTGKYESVLEIE